MSFVISGTFSFLSIRLYIVSLNSKRTLALIAKYSINKNSEYQPTRNHDTKENDIQHHRDYYQQDQKDTGDHFKGCAEIPQMKMTDMQMMFQRLSGHKLHLLPLKLIQTKPSIFLKNSVRKKSRNGVLPEPSTYLYSLWRFFFNT